MRTFDYQPSFSLKHTLRSGCIKVLGGGRSVQAGVLCHKKICLSIIFWLGIVIKLFRGGLYFPFSQFTMCVKILDIFSDRNQIRWSESVSI